MSDWMMASGMVDVGDADERRAAEFDAVEYDIDTPDAAELAEIEAEAEVLPRLAALMAETPPWAPALPTLPDSEVPF